MIKNMRKSVTNLLVAALLIGASSLHAQSSNKVWFVTWNGKPTPSSDVSAQTISSDGSASAVSSGVAGSFISQTNFLSLNSPYDIAVDPAMGKVYVLDNNVQGETPEYIYSFNLTGTPAQIAASAQIIYTMPVPPADVTIPLVSGIALDPVNHWLYFNQIDPTTGTQKFVVPITDPPRKCASVRNSALTTPMHASNSLSSAAPDGCGASLARAEATARLAKSPPPWPPMPSATAHRPISGRASTLSSLSLRTLPTWLTLPVRNIKAPLMPAIR